MAIDWRLETRSIGEVAALHPERRPEFHIRIQEYRRQRYWERRASVWHGRLIRQIGALRLLIRDARETQAVFRVADAPASLHAAFIERCDAVRRSEFGAAYATRVDRRLSETWLQPPGLASEEHIFAWYDTERRIAGLQELTNEAADHLASLGVP